MSKMAAGTSSNRLSCKYNSSSNGQSYRGAVSDVDCAGAAAAAAATAAFGRGIFSNLFWATFKYLQENGQPQKIELNKNRLLNLP